jgi:hypothetical protein
MSKMAGRAEVDARSLHALVLAAPAPRSVREVVGALAPLVPEERVRVVARRAGAADVLLALLDVLTHAPDATLVLLRPDRAVARQELLRAGIVVASIRIRRRPKDVVIVRARGQDVSASRSEDGPIPKGVRCVVARGMTLLRLFMRRLPECTALVTRRLATTGVPPAAEEFAALPAAGFWRDVVKGAREVAVLEIPDDARRIPEEWDLDA